MLSFDFLFEKVKKKVEIKESRNEYQVKDGTIPETKQ